MLDVISGGRLEFGMGRGYQPREAEVFGWPFGSTVQDQERNRSYYHEAYEIILKCWTQPSFSHHGEFYSIPPSYTKWNHQQTVAYFSQPMAGRKVSDVLKVGPPDMYASGSPIVASTTTLREISVFPQPVQKPHPQIWEPTNSERSIRWAAAHGINAFAFTEPNSRIRRDIEIYYDEAERNGWPDRLNRGRWKYGWDAEKHRGFGFGRWVHVIQPGANLGERLERYKRALQLEWDYFQPFGIAAGVADVGEPPYDPGMRVTADLVLEKELAIVGTPDEIVQKIMRIKETCRYEDFCIWAWFEIGGYRTEEIEEQMQIFAEEVMPVLRRECGGGPAYPASSVDLAVDGVRQGSRL